MISRRRGIFLIPEGDIREKPHCEKKWYVAMTFKEHQKIDDDYLWPSKFTFECYRIMLCEFLDLLEQDELYCGI
jgi:hypothetical protein